MNPHIVKEQPGEAYTIQQFVTGKPLTPEEMRPDEHGIYPVSPIGFLMKEDGTTLEPAGNTVGFVKYPVDDTAEQAYLKSYVVVGKYYMFDMDCIAFPVLSIETKEFHDGYRKYEVIVNGLLPIEENQCFAFKNATSDDYAPTGLVGDGVMFPYDSATNPIVHDGEHSVITIEISSGTIPAFTGSVNSGKLILCIEWDDPDLRKDYLTVADETSSEESGIYLLSSGDVPRKAYNYESITHGNEGCSLDLMVGVCAAARIYLEIAHVDGTFEPIECKNSCCAYACPDGCYSFDPANVECPHEHPNDIGVDNYVQHFDNVLMVDDDISYPNKTVRVPLIRIRCYHRDEWFGPFLSSLDGSPYPLAIKKVDSGDTEFYRARYCGPSEVSQPVPDQLSPGEIYFEMSDPWSYPGNPPDDIFMWFFNITNKKEIKCHNSNGYSDTEVAEWVDGKLSGLIRHALHPSSTSGNLGSAGAFVQWFANCAEVDISGAVGHNAVRIPGFGLGTGYGEGCAFGSRAVHKEDRLAGKIRHRLVFGLSSDSEREFSVGGNSVPALAQDWPFKIPADSSAVASDESAFANKYSENNITLSLPGIKVNNRMTGQLRYNYDSPDFPYLMNRVHVCLFNEFQPKSGSDTYAADTIIAKKTFIHLAAPIDVNDGEEFEVTVSLPIITEDAFTSDDDKKNLSAYYAYVSQPRAYVVSGTWNFSNTKVKFRADDREASYFQLDTPFLDENGDTLYGMDIRFKARFNGSRKMTAFRGYMTGSNLIRITDDIGRSITVTVPNHGKEEWDGSICGAAYVKTNTVRSVPGDTRTPIGMNAVRHSEMGPSNTVVPVGALDTDMGKGGQGALDEFNKFFAANKSPCPLCNGTGEDPANEGSACPRCNGHKVNRYAVLYEEDGTPKEDQRQIVATVYPTTTNTFPWAITGRRKMANMDKMMTMDADAGTGGIFARVYGMNSRIMSHILEPMGVNTLTDADRLGPEDYPMELGKDLDELEAAAGTQADSLSLIGAVLAITDVDGDSTDSTHQPVRQALKAAGMLASDYRNGRVSRGFDLVLAGYPELIAGERDPENPDAPAKAHPLNNYDSYGSTIKMQWRNDYEYMANAIRLRHLPKFVAGAGSNVSGDPWSVNLQCYPYPRNGVSEDYSPYYGNPYGYGSYDTTTRTEDVPCEITDTVGTEAYSLMNSVVNACREANLRWMYSTLNIEDLMRSAELEYVDMSDVADDLLIPHGLRGGNGWLETIDAFTKIVSPDGIPVPVIGNPDVFEEATGVSTDQCAFIASDAYGYYRRIAAYGANGYPEVIATAMPVASSLAMFLKDYVPSYGARLPMRNWDGYRIRVSDSLYVDDARKKSVEYLTRMAWNDTACNADLRGQYVADAFAIANSFCDPNLNRIVFFDREAAMTNAPHGCSKPPYTSANNVQDGYVRVYMKFTFSEDAGRWYCTDYRQAPVAYLEPLYGARALERTINGKRVWVDPPCRGFDWWDATQHLYEEYEPQHINSELIGEVMAGPLRRIAVPYLPVDEGGLGLSKPELATGDLPHANFWSVRKNLRPATGGAPCERSNDILWGMYNYPKKVSGQVVPKYQYPDRTSPNISIAED